MELMHIDSIRKSFERDGETWLYLAAGLFSKRLESPVFGILW